jgi:hypothetical protein
MTDTTHNRVISTHDPFCPPGIGKEDPDRCVFCSQIRRVRADERDRIALEVIRLKGRSCPDPDCTDFEIAVWRAAAAAGSHD